MKRIITTGGGLGNQIMSYALWLYLKNKHEKSKLYLRKNDLSNIFFLKDINQKRSRIIEYYIYTYKFFIKSIRFLSRKMHCSQFRLLEKIFPIEVVDYPEWDNYRFISDILPVLKDKLTFPPLEEKQNISIQHIINQNNAVSIHIRRGDYQTVLRWRIILGDICDISYYKQAIEKVYTLIKDPVFFVFSDDIKWSQTNLKLENAYYINWNTGKNSYKDMQLMSMCKINVLANSTFSLCATWLNINENPIRIVPFKWLNLHEDNLYIKYIPEDWLVIDNKKPQISIIVTYEIAQNEIKKILNQKYSDFELILPNKVPIFDDRIIIGGNPRGHFLYYYDKISSKKFNDNKYLIDWISIKIEKDNDEKM